MARDAKGIIIKFGGDTTELDKALRSIRKESEETDKSLRAVNRALKLDPKNTELITQKQTILNKRVEETEKSLKDLQNVQEQLDSQGVDQQSAEYMRVRREIINAENSLKGYEAELRKIDNMKLDNLKSEIEATSAKFKNAGQTMTKYVTLPIVAGGAAAVKTGISFDEAMSQVAATLGTTTDEIQDLRDFAIEMGSSTSFSATESAEALNYMALAGYDAETSMKMLPTVLNLAAAGNMDLATASDMVTDAQSALGLSTDETIQMVDQMAKTASKTNTSVEQLGEAYLTVGGTARSLKGGTAELSAVLGLLGDNGIKGSEGGTALRNILLSLSAPTGKAAKELKALGVDVFDANGNMRSMEDIIGDLNGALDGMTDAERTKALSTIFNKRDLKAVNALLNTNSERWEEVNSAISDAGGAAEQMAETQLDNLGGSLTILKSALEGAAISISDVLSPIIRWIADKITAAVTWFNKQGPTTQKIIVAIGVALATVGPALLLISMGMNLVANNMENMIKIVGGLRKAFTFLASHPIILFIMALVAAITYLWTHSEAFRNFWINLWNNLKAFILNTWNAITGAFTNAWMKIKTTWQNVGAWFRQKWAAIKGVFSGAAAWFGSIFGQAWQNIKSKFAGWAAFWGNLWQTIKSKFVDIGTAIGGAISDAVRNVVNAVISKVESVLNGGIHLINKALSLADKIVPGDHPGWHINDLNFPRLAEGGVLNHARAVIAGEAGPEAIIPLDKLFREMNKMAETMAGPGGGIVINVYGAAGQNVEELAAAVERRLIASVKRGREAWA